jgi:hypothetical protein
VGYRVQGLLLRTKPDVAGLAALEHAYGYKLFVVAGHPLWLLDLNMPEAKPGDLKIAKTARFLAGNYVDALRVIGCDEEPLEQLNWLVAAAAAARQFRQPVMAFLSDDDTYDFAAVAQVTGISVIGDRLRDYLIRWEGGALKLQPLQVPGKDAEPLPIEEFAMIPSTSLLSQEQLPSSGYPLHGNVLAEVATFAPAASVLGLGAWTFGRQGCVTLIEDKGLGHSVWDRASVAAGRAR